MSESIKIKSTSKNSAIVKIQGQALGRDWGSNLYS